MDDLFVFVFYGAVVSTLILLVIAVLCISKPFRQVLKADWNGR